MNMTITPSLIILNVGVCFIFCQTEPGPRLPLHSSTPLCREISARATQFICSCPQKFYKLHYVPICYQKMFYKFSWAWAWV